MLPGFTADRVLDRPSRAYAGASRPAIAPAGAVYAQRIMSPYGPIGLPGQNACEVCWHMCMTFGGGRSDQCRQSCAETCGAGSAGFGMLRGF